MFCLFCSPSLKLRFFSRNDIFSVAGWTITQENSCHLWARMAGWFRWFTGDMGIAAAELKMTHFQTKSSWSWMDRVWGTTVVGQWDLLNGRSRTEESRNHKAIAFYESMGDKQSRLRPKRQRSVWAEWSFMTKNIFCPDSMVWQFPVFLESFYRPRHHQFLRLMRGV